MGGREGVGEEGEGQSGGRGRHGGAREGGRDRGRDCPSLQERSGLEPNMRYQIVLNGLVGTAAEGQEVLRILAADDLAALPYAYT